jgi:hypothetical protein
VAGLWFFTDQVYPDPQQAIAAVRAERRASRRTHVPGPETGVDAQESSRGSEHSCREEKPAVVVTDAELAGLYGDLRAALLSRHFALGRYFRTNFLSLENQLGSLSDLATGVPSEARWDVIRPSTYESASELLAKESTEQVVERWRVGRHARDNSNPLMLTGQLLACLAVEHVLGRSDSLRIIRSVLGSLASLYKFAGDHFDGYIVRQDVATSARWVTAMDGGKGVPLYSCGFLIDRGGRYLYSTPFDHPQYVPPEATSWDERWWSLHLNRSWEPSMDELTGLIMGYDIVFRLVEEESVREEVQRQIERLGDYLAEHGYLLVRPGGGFAAQGASGILPALAFPFGQVFNRIAGNSFPPRNDFAAVLEKAGVWDCIKGPITAATFVADVVIPILEPLLAGVGLPLGVFLAGPAGLGLTPQDLAAAWAISEHGDCFDVWDRSAQSEFAAAFLLMKINLPLRFELWMQGIASGLGQGWASGFAPFIGLTGLDDPNGTVRERYLAWLVKQRPQHPSDPHLAFAPSVAVLLGGGRDQEERVVAVLQQRYDEIVRCWQGNLKVSDGEPEGETSIDLLGTGQVPNPAASPPIVGDPCISQRQPKPNETAPGFTTEYYRPALDFMTALALSWLHAKRRADAGSPVATAGFPSLPDPSVWPPAAVPRVVIEKAGANEIVLPLDQIQRTEPLQLTAAGADLFFDEEPPPKSAELPPILKASSDKQLEIDTWVTVRESDRDVDTGIELEYQDEYEIDANGEIWAGVALTGTNGPNGWSDITRDTKFPLHAGADAHPFSLLGKVGAYGAYFFIGERRERDQHLNEIRRLYLRINDDSPGNGSGAFNCHVFVWRAHLGPPPQEPTIDRTITVAESDGDVYTGILLSPEATYAFDTGGEIWAGVLGTGTNTARGWKEPTTDGKFPLHEGESAFPYSLLAKIVADKPYHFFIGEHTDRTPYSNLPAYAPVPLYLRINDDTPGNGSGQFECRIRVWGTEPNECGDIRGRIAELWRDIGALETAKSGLDPRNPEDKAEIAEINHQIASNRIKIQTQRELAQSKGCFAF